MIPELNNILKGQPESLLNMLLLFIAGTSLTVMIFASADVKLLFAAWFLFP